MADENPEQKHTLRLRSLRTRWQILTLQLVATLALAALLLTMTSVYGECNQDFIDEAEGSTYWCPAFEHTRGMAFVEEAFDRESILPDFITGANQVGEAALLIPSLFCLFLTGVHAYASSRSSKTRRRIKNTIYATVIIAGFGPFFFEWIASMISYQMLYIPFGQEFSALNHGDRLSLTMQLISEIIVMGVVFIPILFGLIGIWNISMRAIIATISYTIMFIIFHALLTFEAVLESVQGIGLKPLPAQIGDSTLFGGLVSPLAFELITISILLFLFFESSHMVIRLFEYVAMLPESARTDNEHIRMFQTVLNTHLSQLIGVLSIATVLTAVALDFDEIMIMVISEFQPNQWSQQVNDSLELQMTYGKVISAGLFLLFVSMLRYLVPWQTVLGWFESIFRGFSGSRSEETDS